MVAEVRLKLPWLPRSPDHLQDVLIGRGTENIVSYDDGITLDVRVLDPGIYPSVEALVTDVEAQRGPGRVVLVAGLLPVEWRAPLRANEISFIDVSGVAEIRWPRLRVSARRFAQPVKRHRSPLPLQKGYALVSQELLIATARGERRTVGELAKAAGVGLSTASRAVSQLAEHGLVAKERDRGHVTAVVVDQVELAEQLAERTKWPGDELLHGYVWGRNVWDVASRISQATAEAEVDIAITGRAGAAFLGVLGTSTPNEVRGWVAADDRSLPEVAEALGLEPAPTSDANVALSTDRWRLGVHRSRSATFEQWTACIAHPLRVWCDLRSEHRGREFAAQLWGSS